MKIALVYDRVNEWGGAERVLLVLNEMFPDAPLYTSVYDPKRAPWAKVFPKVISSFLQSFPLARSRHDLYPWLMPIAFETFNFDGYDLVVSITSEAAKGIITKPHTKHVCYCLTPTRYLWSGYDFYFRNQAMRVLSKPAVSYLRKWDRIAAQRPDVMVGISHAVVDRIKKYYGRRAELIYPPVDIGKFGKKIRNPEVPYLGHPKGEPKGFYLVVSRLVPYKCVDLAIEAFNKLGAPLVIVGTGRGERKLKSMAKKNINFVGELTDGQLGQYYRGCSGLIVPQEEDFGIAAVEAQAFGKPVVAFKAGGVLDTVTDGESGIFFAKQNKKSLIYAIRKLGKTNFEEKKIKANAQRFSKERFNREFRTLIQRFQ